MTHHICRHFLNHAWFGFHLNYNFHRITLLCLTYNTLFYTKYQQVKDIKHIVVTFTSFYSILPSLLLYMYSELQYSKWPSEKKAERIYFLTVNVLVFLNERRMLQMVYKVLDSFIPNCKFSMRKTYTCRCVTVLLWLVLLQAYILSCLVDNGCFHHSECLWLCRIIIQLSTQFQM